MQIAQDVLDGNGKDYLVDALGELGYDDLTRLAGAVIELNKLVDWVSQIEPGATFEWHHGIDSHRIPGEITEQTFPPENGTIARAKKALE